MKWCLHQSLKFYYPSSIKTRCCGVVLGVLASKTWTDANSWCLRDLEHRLSSGLSPQGQALIYNTHFLWFFYAGPFSTATHFRVLVSWGGVMTQFQQQTTQNRMSHITGAESCTALSMQPTVSCMALLQTWGKLLVTAIWKATSDHLFSETSIKLCHLYTASLPRIIPEVHML